MSSSLFSEHQAIVIQNYLHVFPISLLMYDHLLTFGDECRYVWRFPKSVSSICFFLNRYVALLGNISVLVAEYYAPFPAKACKSFQVYRQALLFWTQILCILLLSMRVYALYERSRRVGVGLFLWACVLLAASCWALSRQTSVPGHAELGCHLSFPDKATMFRIALPWEAVFLYDFTLIALTWHKTYKTLRIDLSIAMRRGLSIVALIFRDGILYFISISLANMGNAITYYAIHEPFLKGCLSTFTSCISVTLVSRLMLNLHKHYGRRGVLTTDMATATDFSATRVGNRSSSVELDTLMH